MGDYDDWEDYNFMDVVEVKQDPGHLKSWKEVQSEQKEADKKRSSRRAAGLDAS